MSGALPPAFPGADRRSTERVVARIDVRFREPSQAARALKAYSLNLSVGGLCLKTRKSYQVGSVLQLSMTVERYEYQLKGRVAWELDGAIGVRFEDVNPKDRARLAELVASFQV